MNGRVAVTIWIPVPVLNKVEEHTNEAITKCFTLVCSLDWLCTITYWMALLNIIHITSYTLHHTLHHTHYIIHITSDTLHHTITPYTLHHTHYIIHITSYTSHHTHYIIHITSYTLHHHITSHTLHHTHYIIHTGNFLP